MYLNNQGHWTSLIDMNTHIYVIYNKIYEGDN